MFTGLVEELGVVTSRVRRGPGVRVGVKCAFQALKLGESIAVDGVCLTVVRVLSDAFEADASSETLSCTTLGELGVGSNVHLERAAALGDRMGGHIVTGHVDAIVSLVQKQPSGEAVELVFSYPPDLAPFIAQKGSVAIGGVSLTINRVELGKFWVMIIPHTQDVTWLGRIEIGAKVNIEVDLLARYAHRIMTTMSIGEQAKPASTDESLLSTLARAGYK